MAPFNYEKHGVPRNIVSKSNTKRWSKEKIIQKTFYITKILDLNFKHLLISYRKKKCATLISAIFKAIIQDSDNAVQANQYQNKIRCIKQIATFDHLRKVNIFSKSY